jgi:hypothetical protein
MMMRTRRLLPGAALFLAIALTGCGATGQTASPQPTEEGVFRTVTPTPTPTAYVKPVWDGQSEVDAMSQAESVIRLYARPEAPSAWAWHQTLDSELTEQMRNRLANVDPATLTVHRLTGDAVLDSDRSDPQSIWTTVPTDDGQYRVLLRRAGAGHKWLADAIEKKK